jgi:hypothetical protein
MPIRTLLIAFYWLLGLGSLANGLWMLASPAGWFVGLPAAVTDTGPLNSHFVHDIGVVFAVVGLGAIWCARNLERCLPVHWGITLFYAGHALVHGVEILSGWLPHSHWWIDAPLVFLPALLLIVTGLPAVRRHALTR